MTESQLKLLQESQAYVTDLFLTKVNKSVRFHTLQHTQEVVNACEKLADHYQISDDDRLALYIAAWFHDTGFSTGKAKDHEAVSAQLAKDFFAAHSTSQELVDKVIGCINATRMPQSPSTTIERILCDADLYHLGTDSFKEKTRLLREEIKEIGEEMPKKEWLKNNISFLESHKYFTTYGREKLEPLKELHLAELKEKIKNEIKPDKKDKHKEKEKEKIAAAADQAVKDKQKKDKANQTERGIATVFRIMAQNQTNLSQMADSKANILISVNSIILTIVISTLFTKLDANPNLQIPVILLVLVCVSAIVFSILATRPNVSSGTFTKDDIATKKTNLLFFGNFYKMSLPDYDWAMMELLNDKNYLYGSIVKDNYFLGVVLAKKYRLLRVAYNIFMFGLIIVMLAFAVAFVLPQPVEVYTPG